MKKGIVASFLAVAGFMASSAPTYAEWSANVGYASEYFYRGIYQDESSASAGVDFEANGFNLGTWVADVGDGVETDVYGGYTFGGDDWSLGLGFTGYYYSDDFDDTYEEVNFSASWSFISIGYSVGEWDGFGSPQDYDFLEIGVEYNGFSALFGSFGDEFDGDYFQIGYGTTIADVDVGISFIHSSDFADAGLNGGDDSHILFTLGYGFDL